MLSTLITIYFGLQNFRAGVDQMIFWGFDAVTDGIFTRACQKKIETVLFFETPMSTPDSTVVYDVKTMRVI